MSKLVKLLCAAVLTVAAMISAVPKASARPTDIKSACSQCAAQPNDCFACCMCAGGNSPGECVDICKPAQT